MSIKVRFPTSDKQVANIGCQSRMSPGLVGFQLECRGTCASVTRATGVINKVGSAARTPLAAHCVSEVFLGLLARVRLNEILGFCVLAQRRERIVSPKQPRG
jgi:hypothetical protein